MAAEKKGDDNQRLPRGKHGIPPAQVEKHQRERILRAMIYAVAERGYSGTRVVDVIDEARVSRKTFYRLFEDKEECFLAAYDAVLAMLLRGTETAFAEPQSAEWAERVRRGVAALLTMVAEHPEAARFAIVEVMAAGTKALSRRDSAMRQFTGLIEAGRHETTIELPPITALALVGGIYELMYTELLHGAGAQLPSRLPDLVYWVTLPYLGAERADHERAQTRRWQRGERAENGDPDEAEPVSTS